ncbi:MAG: hypothetical protein ACP5OG_04320 [Candidatus Nanoarchaeia archaeon]
MADPLTGEVSLEISNANIEISLFLIIIAVILFMIILRLIYRVFKPKD